MKKKLTYSNMEKNDYIQLCLPDKDTYSHRCTLKIKKIKLLKIITKIKIIFLP